ncbi:LysR family transcriptional regulator [Nocardia sp. NPDC003183]
MDLDLRLVRYAVVLADELHFARAAARLQIAQQTLSAQIDSLETRLGVRLFLRDRRHVEITPAGELFVRRGRILLTDSQELLGELKNSTPPLRLDVITEGLTTGVIAQELGIRMSDVELVIVQGQGLTGSLSSVADGRIDLAFGRVPSLGRTLPSGLSYHTVRIEALGVALPADHELAVLEQVPMADLVAYPLILHTAEEAVEWENWNDEVVAAFGLTIGWRTHGHGRGSANAAVLRRHAPGFAPLTAPVPDGVVLRPVVDPVPLARIGVVWRSHGRTPARLRRAIGLIHEIAVEKQWLTLPVCEYWLPDTDQV